jgi:hypothetical protein
MSNENTTASTTNDDAGFYAGQDGQSIDDIPVPLGPMGKLLGIEVEEMESLPNDGESELDPEDSTEEDVPQLEDNVDEDDTDGDEDDTDTDTEEDDEDADDDDDSTQDDLPSEDDIDWDYKVPVKVDGEVKHLSLSELRKGFATDQHLSKKGREVSELEKTLKEEYSAKTNQALELGNVLATQLQSEEDSLATAYHDIEAKIEKARKDGDTYELNDLKDKRETAQKDYWGARNKRETLVGAVQKQQQEQFQGQMDELMTKFNEDIKTVVPDFNQEAVREFALAEGIPEDFLDIIMDANVVKFVDDYRKLKQQTSKGSVKRKSATKAKGIPTKRKSTATQRKVRDTNELRSNVLSGKSDEAGELAFLKSMSKFK